MPHIVTTSRRNANRKTPIAPIAISLISIVGIGLCLYLYMHSGNDKQKPRKADLPTHTHKVSDVKEKVDSGTVNAVSTGKEESASIVEDETTPSEATPRETTAIEAESKEIASTNEPVEEVVVEPVFKNISESVLAMLVMGNEGKTENPPLPDLIDTNATPEEIEAQQLKWNQDAINALTNAIVIYEDEDNLTQEQKEKIADLKNQLARIAKEGGSVADALKEFREYMNEGVGLRRQVIAETAKIEDDKEALDYVNKANEELKKEDITPVDLEEVGFVDKDSEGNL